jgi:hypothetical protein
MAAQVETKVQASTATAALSGLALFALGRYVFKGSVPDVVASWVYVLVPGLLTFAAGYLARHTPRPDIPAGNMPADIPAATRAEKTLLPPAAPE